MRSRRRVSPPNVFVFLFSFPFPCFFCSAQLPFLLYCSASFICSWCICSSHVVTSFFFVIQFAHIYHIYIYKYNFGKLLRYLFKINNKYHILTSSIISTKCNKYSRVVLAGNLYHNFIGSWLIAPYTPKTNFES